MNSRRLQSTIVGTITIAAILGSPPRLVGQEIDFEYRCVILKSQSTEDQLSELPLSAAEVVEGETFYVELWATDSGPVNTGLTSVYADLDHLEGTASCVDTGQSALFGLFADGVCQPPLVDVLGASQLTGGVGVAPEWARVAWVEYLATETGTASFQLHPASSESAAFGRGLVPTESIDYGACSTLVVPAVPDPVLAHKPIGSRYLRFEAPPTTAGEHPDEIVRITCLSLDGFPAPPTNTFYVDPPYQAPDENTMQPGLTMTAAPLSCSPHAHPWSLESVVNAYGAEIMPRSEYAIQRAYADCTDLLTSEQCWSHPVIIATGAFGDVIEPWYVPQGPPQPDFNDISAIVAKFLANPDTPTKAMAQLQPNVVFPSRPTDFNDIAASVAAFLGVPYPLAIDASGPCACPSTVACGVTVCTQDAQCGDGYCIGGFCTDACGRCAN